MLAGLGGALEDVAQAQEALRSALSLDPILKASGNPVAELPPDQLHWGPVQLTLGVYTGAEFVDNINNSQKNPQSDTIVRGGMNLGFVWPATPQSSLRLSSDVGYAAYLEHHRSDTLEIAPNSVLSWGVAFEDGSLTWFDQFNYVQEVITLAAISGVSQLPRFDNTIGARMQWQPGRWQLELSLSRNDYFSTDASLNYLNRGSEYVSLRGSRYLAEDTQIGVEASVSVTAYELPIQSNNRSYSLGPYLEWKVTPFFKVSLHGGPTLYSFDATGRQPASNLNAYYVNLDLNHQLTEFISQGLSLQRNVSLGLQRGNNYIEQLTASYTVNWAVFHNFDLGLNLAYETGSQPLAQTLAGAANEQFGRVGINPTLSYQFSQKLSGNLNYSHWERTSNIAGNTYSENSIGLIFRYAF